MSTPRISPDAARPRLRGPADARARAALACVAAAAIAAPPATSMATDSWSITGFVNQRVEADSNIQLDPDTNAEAYGSTTRAGLNFTTDTSTTQFTFTPSLTGRLFGGDGSTSEQDRVLPSATARISHRVARVDLSGGVTLDIRPTTFSEIGEIDSDVDAPTDLDLVDQNAIQISFRGNGGATYHINETNQLSLQSFVSLRRYDDDADSLSPSTTIGLNTDYSHDVNERLTALAGMGIRRVEIDGSDGSESYVYDVTAGLRGAFTPRFSGGGRAGVNLIRTDSDEEGVSHGVGFTASGDLLYRPTEDLRLSLNASQDLEPSSNGRLETRTRIGLVGAHQINSRESIDASIRFSRQGAADTFSGDSEEQAQATLSYAQALTPDLSASFGYTVRRKLNSPDEATSHKVFLSLSKSFSIIP